MFLLSKVVTMNMQLAVVLMTLDIKYHAVPHLKDLNSGMEP